VTGVRSGVLSIYLFSLSLSLSSKITIFNINKIHHFSLVQIHSSKCKHQNKEKERETELNMGLCFSFLFPPSAPPQSSSSFNKPPLSSGSTSTIGFSATTSSAGRSQFSEVASGSIDGTTEGSLRFASPNGQILERPNLKVFSFGDMKSATRGFKPDTLLGEGGFGKVYKGWLDEKTLTPAKAGSGVMVAIKKLNSESTQGFQEWQVSLI
jgi:hypothetical protein